MIEPRDIDRFRRELRALVAKADDPEGFAQAVILAGELDEALAAQANHLRERMPNGQPGFSWADLARPLSISRQAAQQRFGRLHRAARSMADAAGEVLAADVPRRWE